MTENRLPEWALGGFVRPAGVNPVILPRFAGPVLAVRCVRIRSDGWRATRSILPQPSGTGRFAYFFAPRTIRRPGIGKRTSRIGLARSVDGVTMRLGHVPVLFPGRGTG